VTATYAFICSEEGNYQITSMCRWATVARSGYYAWKERTPSPTAQRRALLAVLVAKSFDDSDGTYGYRRVHADLLAWGHPCHVETVRSIMRELGLVACQPRAYKVTTRPGPDPEPVADLVHRDFTATEPGTKLVGDITYLRTDQGWLYLATVIDLFNREVVGWSMAEHMRTTLISDALRMAYTHGRIAPGALFHSDYAEEITKPRIWCLGWSGWVLSA